MVRPKSRGKCTSLRKKVDRKKGWRKRYEAERALRNIPQVVTENDKGVKDYYIQSNNKGDNSHAAGGVLSAPEDGGSSISCCNDETADKEISEQEPCDDKNVEEILTEKYEEVPKLTPLISKLQEHLKSCRRKLVPSDKSASKTEQKLSDENDSNPGTLSTQDGSSLSPTKRAVVRYVCQRGPKFQGRPLSRDMQAAIWNTIQYCKLEKALQAPAIDYNKVTERVAAILQLSTATVSKYSQKAKQDEELLTPGKERDRVFTKLEVDPFDRVAIENLIYGLTRQRIHFTCGSLLNEIRRMSIGFDGGRESLRKLLRVIGFSYVVSNGSRFLREKPEVTTMKTRFLKRYMDAKPKYYFVFTDETWIFRKGTGKRRSWENNDIKSSALRDASFGERYVVIGAGGRDGFIPNSIKVFPTKSKPLPGEDYHGDVTGELWLRWAEEQLIPNLPDKPCALFLDNASYHRIQAYSNGTCISNGLEARISPGSMHFYGDFNAGTTAGMYFKWAICRGYNHYFFFLSSQSSVYTTLQVQFARCMLESWFWNEDPENQNPTTKTKIADLIKWLQDRNIDLSGHKTRKELYELARGHKNLVLRIEKLLEGTGHILIWFPPYHPLFNPIELVWGICKSKYSKEIDRAFLDASVMESKRLDPNAGVPDVENVGPRSTVKKSVFGKASTKRISASEIVLKCMKEALEEVTPEVWSRCCDHTEKEIMKHHDEIQNTVAAEPHPSVVFDVGLSSGDSSSDDDGVQTLSGREELLSSKLVGTTSQFVPPKPHPPAQAEVLNYSSRKRQRNVRKALFAAFTAPNDDPAILLRQRQYFDASKCKPDAVSENTYTTNVPLRRSLHHVGTGDREIVSREELLVDSTPNLDTEFTECDGKCDKTSSDAHIPQSNDEALSSSELAESSVNVVLLDDDPNEWWSPEPEQNGRLRLDDRDRKSLAPCRWLTDQVIDYYLKLLCQRDENIRLYSVHFSLMLQEAHKARDMRLLKIPARSRINILDCQKIIFPFFVNGNHWTLCSVDVHAATIVYYDSNGGRNNNAVEAVKDFLKHRELQVQSSLSRKWTTFQALDLQDLPQQDNSYDCGLYVCWYARCILRNIEIPAERPNMVLFREQVQRELHNWELEPMLEESALHGKRKLSEDDDA